MPNYCKQGYHIFSLILKNKKEADNFINFLKKNNITVKKHYTDLSSSPFSRNILKNKYTCETSKILSERLVRLPLYSSLKNKDVNRIIKLVKKFKNL